jgi:hypothetical protein
MIGFFRPRPSSSSSSSKQFLMWPRICGQVLRVFVPKGQNEGSQVRSAWKSGHW